MEDPLTDCSPLISAAASGKLRLVRLLVEGGAQVNGSNPKGETPLLAACKALRGEPAGPETLKLLRYLLQNKADPNAKDHAGRTALMYACMQQAGVKVAQTLLAAGADPCTEDFSGASALVHAINAQHPPTAQVLMDTCRARGRDIIIIATEMGVNGNPVTKRYLNVPSSPVSSPVSCMSPSDIILKTGSPKSPEGENIFNFRGTGKHGSCSCSRCSSCELSPLSPFGSPASRPRISSEPWLAIQDLASLNRTYEDGVMERSRKEQGDRRGEGDEKRDQSGVEQKKEGAGKRCENHTEEFLSLGICPGTGGSEKLRENWSPHSQLRRNTLPSLTVAPPLLHLPPLKKLSNSHLEVPSQVSPSIRRTMLFQPHPPCSSPPVPALRPASLPPLSSSTTSLVAHPACCERSKWSLRRHSAQLEQIRGGNFNL